MVHHRRHNADDTNNQERHLVAKLGSELTGKDRTDHRANNHRASENAVVDRAVANRIHAFLIAVHPVAPVIPEALALIQVCPLTGEILPPTHILIGVPRALCIGHRLTRNRCVVQRAVGRRQVEVRVHCHERNRVPVQISTHHLHLRNLEVLHRHERRGVVVLVPLVAVPIG
ncbi:hypothetical protein DQ04_20251010 [Trypanosoma grayi]|uniref:hypothetical protein n=1 Tax=Trypanosoma grayi TaxID=71804 RepID=UPI0004F45CBA|nr:hypothetical protein DQ04_20251010 [Trypanosoma grayi]KEG05584.1 hypothetical protein DQ04_20251010 [Trypanosoma grayi]